jgi:hypothetical protein
MVSASLTWSFLAPARSRRRTPVPAIGCSLLPRGARMCDPHAGCSCHPRAIAPAAHAAALARLNFWKRSMGMTTNVSRTPIGWRLPDEEYIGRVKPDPRTSYLQQHDDRILLSHQYRAHAHRMTACDIMPRWTGSDQSARMTRASRAHTSEGTAGHAGSWCGARRLDQGILTAPHDRTRGLTRDESRLSHSAAGV